MNRWACVVFAVLVSVAGACGAGEEDENGRPEEAAAIEPTNELSVDVEKDQLERDPACTISCSFWNLCRARNLGNPTVCGAEPEGCCCRTFHGC